MRKFFFFHLIYLIFDWFEVSASKLNGNVFFVCKICYVSLRFFGEQLTLEIMDSSMFGFEWTKFWTLWKVSSSHIMIFYKQKQPFAGAL